MRASYVCIVALGLRRPEAASPTVELRVDHAARMTHGAKLRRLESLDRLTGLVLRVKPDDWQGLADAVVELGHAYHRDPRR